jgi:hypothetical protein
MTLADIPPGGGFSNIKIPAHFTGIQSFWECPLFIYLIGTYLLYRVAKNHPNSQYGFVLASTGQHASFVGREKRVVKHMC